MNEFKGETYRKYGFWAFCSENPIMVIITLVIVLGLVAIIMGYREGFASVLTGLFGFMKKDDTDRKLEMKELEVQKIEAENRLTEYELSGMKTAHDEEVEESVQSAKAYVDDLDMDELVAVGNNMLDGGISHRSSSAAELARMGMGRRRS